MSVSSNNYHIAPKFPNTELDLTPVLPPGKHISPSEGLPWYFTPDHRSKISEAVDTLAHTQVFQKVAEKQKIDLTKASFDIKIYDNRVSLLEGEKELDFGSAAFTPEEGLTSEDFNAYQHACKRVMDLARGRDFSYTMPQPHFAPYTQPAPVGSYSPFGGTPSPFTFTPPAEGPQFLPLFTPSGQVMGYVCPNPPQQMSFPQNSSSLPFINETSSPVSTADHSLRTVAQTESRFDQPPAMVSATEVAKQMQSQEEGLRNLSKNYQDFLNLANLQAQIINRLLDFLEPHNTEEIQKRLTQAENRLAALEAERHRLKPPTRQVKDSEETDPVTYNTDDYTYSGDSEVHGVDISSEVPALAPSSSSSSASNASAQEEIINNSGSSSDGDDETEELNRSTSGAGSISSAKTPEVSDVTIYSEVPALEPSSSSSSASYSSSQRESINDSGSSSDEDDETEELNRSTSRAGSVSSAKTPEVSDVTIYSEVPTLAPSPSSSSASYSSSQRESINDSSSYSDGNDEQEGSLNKINPHQSNTQQELQLRNEIRGLEEALKKAQEQNGERKNEFDLLATHYRNLLDSKRKLEENQASFPSDELDKLKKEYDLANATLEKANSEIERLAAELENRQNNNVELANNLNELAAPYQKLEESKGTLKEDLEKQIEELNRKLDEAKIAPFSEDELDMLKEEYNNKLKIQTQNLEKLIEENGRLGQVNNDLRNGLEEREKDLRDLQVKMLDKETKNEELKKTSLAQKNRIQSEKENHKKTAENFKQVQRDLAIFQEDNKKKETDLEALRSKVKNLQNLLEDSNKNKLESEKEVKNQSELNSQRIATIQAQKQQIAKLQKEIEKDRQDIKAARIGIEEAHARKDKIERKTKELKKEAKELGSDNIKLREGLAGMSAENKALQAELERKHAELEALKKIHTFENKIVFTSVPGLGLFAEENDVTTSEPIQNLAKKEAIAPQIPRKNRRKALTVTKTTAVAASKEITPFEKGAAMLLLRSDVEIRPSEDVLEHFVVTLPPLIAQKYGLPETINMPKSTSLQMRSLKENNGIPRDEKDTVRTTFLRFLVRLSKAYLTQGKQKKNKNAYSKQRELSPERKSLLDRLNEKNYEDIKDQISGDTAIDLRILELINVRQIEEITGKTIKWVAENTKSMDGPFFNKIARWHREIVECQQIRVKLTKMADSQEEQG